MNVAILGSGGREHALAWRLAESPRLSRLFALPGNPGTRSLAENVKIDPVDLPAVRKFCVENKIGLAVIGPEAPLAMGVADELRSAGVAVFGPSKSAARLEADKAFAKELMRQQAVPTAEAKVFTRFEPAEAYVERLDGPCVVKAAGLAAGKGVTICYRTADAIEALNRAMRRRDFGEAGETVIVEELMTGPEASVLALVDRRDLFIMDPCQDHKPVDDGDTGPMTGGMGAYCPAPVVTPKLLEQIERDVLIPTLDGLAREGIDYSGILYAGVMLTEGGPKVLEFNCRFGDPETQPLMVRWRGDLLEAMLAVAEGRLASSDAAMGFDPRPAVCVVASSKGYPGRHTTGDAITGIEAAEEVEGVQVFHAGTAMKGDRLVTAGGRVLGVTAIGDTVADAQRLAYEAMGRIKFAGMHYRRDIGHRAVRAEAAG